MREILLVLLPGMDGTGILFEPLVRALPGHIRPLVVRYPPDIPLTYEQLLPLVNEALPRHEPYILLGESFSGPLALMAAAENPSNLKALILCATFIRNPLPWLPSWFRHLAFTPFFHFRPTLLTRALASGFATPNVTALLDRIHGAVRPEVMAARARAILGVDAEEVLKSVKVPLFFLGGADDRLTPPGNLRDIIRARPDVLVSLLPGPHMILQTKPEESAAAIGEMVTRVLTDVGEA